MTKYLLAAFVALSLSFCAAPDLFAADLGVPVVVVTPKAVSVLNDFAAKIPAELPALIVGILVFLSELLMRLVPTVKPRSLLIVVGNLFAGVGLIFTKLSKLADNLVQNLKDPAQPEQSEKKDG